VGDEREKHPRADEPDVEAHRHHLKGRTDVPNEDHDDDDDQPDVEAHHHKGVG